MILSFVISYSQEIAPNPCSSSLDTDLSLRSIDHVSKFARITLHIAATEHSKDRANLCRCRIFLRDENRDLGILLWLHNLRLRFCTYVYDRVNMPERIWMSCSTRRGALALVTATPDTLSGRNMKEELQGRTLRTLMTLTGPMSF